jgi:hypothetical protein
MASEQSVLNVMGRALWDANPTKTDLQSRQLAAALGYPLKWRVVRSIDEHNGHLVDRIYSDKPGTGCDTWFNHASAMAAATKWDDPELCNQTPHAFNGGHLLPLQPLYDIGDKVQVLYEDEWWDAKILRRKEYPGIFKYQVLYPADTSKQSGVEEYLIRTRPVTDDNHGIDPEQVASTLGFDKGWKAYSAGHNRWKVISPDGVTYKSKKAALDAMMEANKTSLDEGDPPWRTTDNIYLGRRVKWITKYNASARRTVDLVQIGTVVGWISESDTDKDGQPGFISEQTGKPAKLYHVTFDIDRNHTYFQYMLPEQDMEEWELLQNLLSDEAISLPLSKNSKK